ncbi:FAD synthase isoform X1 [Mycetomoellerius zeteki]|uniref:FAD synthase isoform X1 n=1 Tax=Mycetomoellerius zeteki TaxID=64791 RepID=UPI00084E956C|nr:PREDICTED: FAD synthase-like isoform X1 [Trachymyrmex zeteki]XP_018315308.1 PREDICTED: FAD synthase-like isoform X1 [Trachymyrmex zeteki]
MILYMAIGRFFSVVRQSCCLNNQYSFYSTTMTSLLVPPASVRGMMCLDRDAFTRVVTVSTLKLRDISVSKNIRVLKKYLLKMCNFKSVQKINDGAIIYLNPDIVMKFEDITENDRKLLVDQYEYFGPMDITLKYDNWRRDVILKSILPEDIEVPTAYSLVGDIMQLNLRDVHLPYKSIIGQIFLDKTANARTVVNKIDTINTSFRYFAMEILAGERNTITSAKEHGCTYQFDFAQVYWNPRLSTEHTRIVTFMTQGDVLYDVFAGVGPFAIPAARKKVQVFANDLNPESYKWLQKNALVNKSDMSQQIHHFCTASLIVVGDEILRGQIIDTNTSYLAKNLTAAGIKLQKVIMVSDIVDDIVKEIRNASKQYSIVFTSGGVGPTHDDVTYEAVAKAFELKLELNQELFDIYTRMIPDQAEIKRLAIVPNTCKIIIIDSGAFPVVNIKNVYVLPGSPKYFKPAADTIISRLKGCTPFHFEYIDIALDELSIVNVLDKQAKRWDGKVKIGSYPQYELQTPFTRITLEGFEETIAEAKEELLYHLPIQKIINLKHKFSNFQMNIVLENSKSEMYIKCALDILNDCYERYNPNEIFISFNGGKDCTVVLHLAATVAKLRNITSLLCLYVTDDSFPEVEAFVESAAQYYGLEIIRMQRPIKSALSELLEEKHYLKAALMGTRKGDPGSENLQAFTPTDPNWPQLIRVNPILHWSYSQVWTFLLKHNIPYCSLYDQGYTSIGNRNTTIRNPLLKDPNNPSFYLPAYTLTDKSAEREGRECEKK